MREGWGGGGGVEERHITERVLALLTLLSAGCNRTSSFFIASMIHLRSPAENSAGSVMLTNTHSTNTRTTHTYIHACMHHKHLPNSYLQHSIIHMRVQVDQGAQVDDEL